ncbi:hypothetical protein ACFFQF_26180 [Haladaptatus pallidirubidus]|uniref:DUF7504 family protein n=1 Tax=Haladaptatus pallidirubidus TaxID=1008152 RepID=UPI0035EF327C
MKQRGCSLLVTGAVPKCVTAQATQRLLGDPHRDRKRLLVFTDASPEHVEHSLPPNVRRNDESTQIIESCGTYRSTPSESQSTDTRDCEVEHLRNELAHATSYFDTVTDGLGPGNSESVSTHSNPYWEPTTVPQRFGFSGIFRRWFAAFAASNTSIFVCRMSRR